MRCNAGGRMDGKATATSKRHKVTVLIGTYNHGGFIETAVDSALEQAPVSGDVQIVVVDDGSTDDTRERLRRYGSAIDYVHQRNGGQASAWNLGLSRSDGELIAFLDADDMWHREKLVRVVEEFDKTPDVGVVSHALTVINDRGIALAQVPDFSLRPDAATDRRPLGAYLRGRPPVLPPTSGIAVRAAVLAGLTPIPEDFRGGSRGEGPDLYLAYLLAFYAREFTFIDEPLGRYRIHGPSLREGGVEHPEPGYLATRAKLYRQLCGEVARAGADVGCDVAAITRKFQAIARESELQCHARSGRRLQALQLVWEHDDPEFDHRLATRLFRRASLTLDVLMPNASYSAWRSWYRGSRLFRLMHRAQPIRD